MTVRHVSFAIDEYYHLYSRGVDKRPIFFDEEDRKRFARLLYLSNGTGSVVYRETRKRLLSSIENGPKITAIGAYCLMSNHFHLLVKETDEGGIVKFMSKLLTAYSSYFNKKYKRTGALFGSEFKSSHIDSDEYLKYLFAYIHLNPVKIISPNWKTGGVNAGEARDFLEKYRFSSYHDYVQSTERDEKAILSEKLFPKYFDSESAWAEGMLEWLSIDYQGEGLAGKTGDKSEIEMVA